MGPSPDDSGSDATLIEAINRGEAWAFEALYYRYRDWVVRLAFRFTGHREDALDVLQETFAYFHRKCPGFNLSAKMTTFLYPVVKHLALAARRKRARYAVSEPALDAADESQSLAASHSESVENLRYALSSLPEERREVVLMRFVDGLELAEIAEALGVPVGTVKSRLHNALARLRADERTRRYFQR